MYRRIELIHPRDEIDMGPFGTLVLREGKAGIFASRCPWGVREIMDAKLRMPRRRVKHCRHYFTERGWEEVGRDVIAECRRCGQEYRVITIKEKSVDVVWRDAAGLQVGVRARKKVAANAASDEY